MSSALPIDRAANTPSVVTILVVEDEILVRLALADELRQQGYVVVEAESGDEATTILHSGVNIDLVLTDVRMPGHVDGLGLARVVRSMRPSTSVVMASGHLPCVEAADLVDGFLSKPYDYPKLFEVIRAILERRNISSTPNAKP